MKKHLRIILPLQFDPAIRDSCIEAFRPHLPHVELSLGFVLEATESTVSEHDLAMNAPAMLAAVKAAVLDGCHGILLDVAFDTALPAAKAIAPVPVVGALEAAVACARTLCRRFSILAINDEEVPVDHRLAREYGFVDMLTSVEPIDVPVRRLRDDPAHTLERLTDASRRAVSKGAQAVVLGCTAMTWVVPTLRTQIPVPVLDPNLIGLYMLDALTQLELVPSRHEYPTPSGLRPLGEDQLRRLREVTFRVR